MIMGVTLKESFDVWEENISKYKLEPLENWNWSCIGSSLVFQATVQLNPFFKEVGEQVDGGCQWNLLKSQLRAPGCWYALAMSFK
jgi:hypothetical protein